MKIKFFFVSNVIFLCLAFNGLQGQSNRLHLRDTSIVLLKQLRNFTTYKMTFTRNVHPLYAQPSYSDTTQINYYCDSLDNNIEFSVYVLNYVIGLVKNDSCRIYSISGNDVSLKTIHCHSCKSWLSDCFFAPLYNDDWLKRLTNDSTLNISLEYVADTIKLRLSRYNEIINKGLNSQSYYVEYYFNSKNGFPLKYIDHYETSDDVQDIEYRVIEYSIIPDPHLNEYLIKLFSSNPTVIPNDLFSH